MQAVAALYVQSDGCYANLPGVEVWGIERDARLYAGPFPVVAHPPCQKWGKLARVNFRRWGGEHNRPGEDGGCFAAALRSVETWGGVLEHPAGSYAWPEHGIIKPLGRGWVRARIGWTCEVWQSAYGHRANKSTWLYYVGETLPPILNWARLVGTHQVGFPDQRGKEANKPTLSKREANATPEPFRDLLLEMARTARSALTMEAA